jgi:hypothetical protein
MGLFSKGLEVWVGCLLSLYTLKFLISLVIDVHSIMTKYVGSVQSLVTTLAHILEIYPKSDIRKCNNKEF